MHGLGDLNVTNKQNKTKQNKTKQNKTKQNKTNSLNLRYGFSPVSLNQKPETDILKVTVKIDQGPSSFGMPNL